MGRRMARRRGLVAVVAVAVIAVAAFVALTGEKTEPEVVTYETEAVETGAISVTVSGSGYVELGDYLEVWPEGAGTVESIEVDLGSVVETDQLLMTLDDTSWDVDDEVLAPQSGLIWSLSVAEDDEVDAPAASQGTDDEAPFVIVPSEPLAVRIDINEVDVPALAVGQRATVTFDALPDLSVTGSVLEIDREGTITQGVVTFGVWIELDLQADELRPGMSAVGTIVTAVAQDSLLVPNAAINTSDEGAEYVEVMDLGAETPRAISVTTGLRSATHTVIESGLAAGEHVVIKTATPDEDAEAETAGGFAIPGMGRPR